MLESYKSKSNPDGEIRFLAANPEILSTVETLVREKLAANS